MKGGNCCNYETSNGCPGRPLTAAQSDYATHIFNAGTINKPGDSMHGVTVQYTYHALKHMDEFNINCYNRKRFTRILLHLVSIMQVTPLAHSATHVPNAGFTINRAFMNSRAAHDISYMGVAIRMHVGNPVSYRIFFRKTTTAIIVYAIARGTISDDNVYTKNNETFDDEEETRLNAYDTEDERVAAEVAAAAARLESEREETERIAAEYEESMRIAAAARLESKREETEYMAAKRITRTLKRIGEFNQIARKRATERATEAEHKQMRKALKAKHYDEIRDLDYNFKIKSFVEPAINELNKLAKDKIKIRNLQLNLSKMNTSLEPKRDELAKLKAKPEQVEIKIKKLKMSTDAKLAAQDVELNKLRKTNQTADDAMAEFKQRDDQHKLHILAHHALSDEHNIRQQEFNDKVAALSTQQDEFYRNVDAFSIRQNEYNAEVSKQFEIESKLRVDYASFLKMPDMFTENAKEKLHDSVAKVSIIANRLKTTQEQIVLDDVQFNEIGDQLTMISDKLEKEKAQLNKTRRELEKTTTLLQEVDDQIEHDHDVLYANRQTCFANLNAHITNRNRQVDIVNSLNQDLLDQYSIAMIEYEAMKLQFTDYENMKREYDNIHDPNPIGATINAGMMAKCDALYSEHSLIHQRQLTDLLRLHQMPENDINAYISGEVARTLVEYSALILRLMTILETDDFNVKRADVNAIFNENTFNNIFNINTNLYGNGLTHGKGKRTHKRTNKRTNKRTKRFKDYKYARF